MAGLEPRVTPWPCICQNIAFLSCCSEVSGAAVSMKNVRLIKSAYFTNTGGLENLFHHATCAVVFIFYTKKYTIIEILFILQLKSETILQQ